MSRNAEIEAIHEARHHLQTCAEKDKPDARKKLYALLAQAAAMVMETVEQAEVGRRKTEGRGQMISIFQLSDFSFSGFVDRPADR